MPKNCGIEIGSIPALNGCPADDEYFLTTNAPGGYGTGKYALRSWYHMKACICLQMNDDEIFIVNGVEMTDGGDPPGPGNKYINTDYAGIELVVFYNGINRFLLPETEYVLLEEGGFQCLFQDAFTSEDNFVVFPNEGPCNVID